MVANRQALPGGPSMRPPRLVLVGAVVISVLAANDAQARPRLPAIFGAMMFGAMGGMVGLHHRHAYSRSHSRVRQANAPAQTPSENEPAQSGTATAAPMGTSGPVYWPQLADDVFDYTFWPSGKDDRLWAYGYDDIVGVALRPDTRAPAPRRSNAQA